MKRLLVVIVALLVFAPAACGSDDGEGDAADTAASSTAGDIATSSAADPTTETSGPTTATDRSSTTIVEATQFVDVYFVRGNGYATAVATAVPATSEIAANAVRALIAGPTPAQLSAGLWSSVPTDTRLLGLSIDDGLVRVDLSSEFESGGGTFSMTARLGQVVYTLTGFPTIDEVEFWIDGTPVTVFSSEGLVLDGPVDRLDYLAALPLSPTLLDDVEVWQQDDLPDTTAFGDIRRVVLVPINDVLNVRLAAGVDNELIGMLAPGAIVGLTGPQTDVAGSTWFELVTPAGAGWVNSHFLAEVVDDDDFGSDERVSPLLDRLTEIIMAGDDLNEVASARGLYISHHDRPVRFSPDQLRTALTEPTVYKWPSNAFDVTDPIDAAEIPGKTFAEAIGESFTSTWDDPDRIFKIDEVILGGNGRTEDAAIWPELGGFHFVSVQDPGDNPDFGGLDWIIWHVSIDYEDNQPVIVGLTIDQWSP